MSKFIEGKPFAGVMTNVGSYGRSVEGVLKEDLKERGFSNLPIYTSTVEKLHLESGVLYAVTRNSAYELASLNLSTFLSSDFLKEKLVEALLPESSSVHQTVSKDEFKALVLSLSVGQWEHQIQSEDKFPRTLKIGNITYVEGE